MMYVPPASAASSAAQAAAPSRWCASMSAPPARVRTAYAVSYDR